MPPTEKPTIGGQPANVYKHFWWIDAGQGIIVVVDPKTGAATQGRGMRHAEYMLADANKALQPHNQRTKRHRPS